MNGLGNASGAPSFPLERKLLPVVFSFLLYHAVNNTGEYDHARAGERAAVDVFQTNLTTLQKFRLRDLLRYNLQTVRAYLLKEDFQQFWDYTSPTWAGMFLDFWCYQAMHSRIEPMKKIARTLRAHRALLLNYFKARKEFSSGVVEGLNNKAKVTIRRSYGFRTFRILELALYHSLAKLPEPALTHEFF